MDPRSPVLGPEGLAAQACRSDIEAGYSRGLFCGFAYGVMFMSAVLIVASTYWFITR